MHLYQVDWCYSSQSKNQTEAHITLLCCLYAFNGFAAHSFILSVRYGTYSPSFSCWISSIGTPIWLSLRHSACHSHFFANVLRVSFRFLTMNGTVEGEVDRDLPSRLYLSVAFKYLANSYNHSLGFLISSECFSASFCPLASNVWAFSSTSLPYTSPRAGRFLRQVWI